MRNQFDRDIESFLDDRQEDILKAPLDMDELAKALIWLEELKHRQVENNRPLSNPMKGDRRL